MRETAISPRRCPRCISSSPRSRRWCRRWKMPARSCGCWRAQAPARRSPPTPPSPQDLPAKATQTGRTPYHVVLLDNGRSEMLGGDFQDMLRCIRCGACLNHCPVYGAIGGHAYGSLYPGPMGAVLTPALYGIDHARDLPNASSFCGRCEEVCPMAIPLPAMMRKWRERDFERGDPPLRAAAGAAAVGLRGEASAPLSCAWGDDRAAARPSRRKPGTFQRASLRRRLDGHPRSACAARQDVS